MNDYDRKTAGMVGALLFALGLVVIALMMIGSLRSILIFSILSLSLIIIGMVLLSEADKTGKKE